MWDTPSNTIQSDKTAHMIIHTICVVEDEPHQIHGLVPQDLVNFFIICVSSMHMLQLIKEHADKLQELCQKSLVERLELFGSATTNEYILGKSDLDFIVTYKPEVQRTWLSIHLNLKESLEKLFKSNVDLISNIPMKNPYFRKAVNETRLCVFDGKKIIYYHNTIKPSSMRHDARKYLWDIQKNVKEINKITHSKSYEEYIQDFFTQKVVMWNYTIIGEAINALARVDEQTASQITNYKDYIGLRNVLVHKYDDIDHYKVWSKIKDGLHILEQEVDSILNKLD